MRTERRTDTTKVTVDFRNFTKAPDNIHMYVCMYVCVYTHTHIYN